MTIFFLYKKKFISSNYLKFLKKKLNSFFHQIEWNGMVDLSWTCESLNLFSGVFFFYSLLGFISLLTFSVSMKLLLCFFDFLCSCISSSHFSFYHLNVVKFATVLWLMCRFIFLSYVDSFKLMFFFFLIHSLYRSLSLVTIVLVTIVACVFEVERQIEWKKKTHSFN